MMVKETKTNTVSFVPGPRHRPLYDMHRNKTSALQEKTFKHEGEHRVPLARAPKAPQARHRLPFIGRAREDNDRHR